jgi:alpha-amylase/alpha-mannosidase (GH57 family)
VASRLYVAILWHMHQPEYRDLRDGRARLPWVRLHAASHYLRMAEILAAHPRTRLTVNLVPSLTEQLAAWAGGGPPDHWAVLAAKSHWSKAERTTIRRHFWPPAAATGAQRFPALVRLAEIRDDPGAWSDAALRQLVGLFELAWTRPAYLTALEPLLARAGRGEPLTAADIGQIHARQRAVAGEVVPAYRRLAQRGQIELATSPYYHPILPLLVDPAGALEATPDLQLPSDLLVAPADATHQLADALRAHEATFGRAPAGLWPPEGAVGQAILPHLPAGPRWLVTDEAILQHSLAGAYEPLQRYRPWQVEGGTGPMAVFFRDRDLSDRLGFHYQHLSAERAVADFLGGLHAVRQAAGDTGPAPVVTVALDGENPWPTYEGGGDPFLRLLYRRLAEDPALVLTTFGDYLDRHPVSDRLPWLATGSWIGGDLTTWIGTPAHCVAWELLARARRDLVAAAPAPDGAPLAWRSLWAAEGSDWFWWYSDRHHSTEDHELDQCFRTHLANTYRTRGAAVPARLARPITATAGRLGAMAPGLADARDLP